MDIEGSVERARIASKVVITMAKNGDDIMFTVAALVLLMVKETGRSETEILDHLQGVLAIIREQARELS